MGILNVTPDSFSDGGRLLRPADAVRQAERLVREGADLLDVGGESTRPGAEPVRLAEELRRVVPVIRLLARRVRVPISVDTAKAEVARQALAAGASIINDVTALRGDSAMADVAARAGVLVILMHMRGDPRTMQRAPCYHRVTADIAAFLRGAVERATQAGIRPDRILIDPGLGFGKTVSHNLRLLAQLPRLARLGYPLVIGPSRKSFIGTLAGGAGVDDRLPGTLACVAAAARVPRAIVRVHDVAAAVQFLTIQQAIAHAARHQH